MDYADPSGIYYKHRIVMVDGEPIVRHSFFSDDWMINSACIPFMLSHPEHGTPEALAREVEDVRLPRAADTLKEICQRVALDYFGIDCHIDADGQVTVFEANANMDCMIRGIEELNHRVDRIKERLEALVQARSGETFH